MSMSMSASADRQYRRMLDGLIAKAGAGKLTHLQISCDKARKQPTPRKLEAARTALLNFLLDTKLTEDEWLVVAEDDYYQLQVPNDSHELAKPATAYAFAKSATIKSN